MRRRKPKGYMTDCGTCPRVIDTSNEPSGFLYTFRGKPICSVCRVLKKTHSKELLKDRKETKEKIVMEERKRVELIAQASQENTQSTMK